jgi:glutamate 5-kinase
MKIVVKVGTSSLTDKNGFLNQKYISELSSSIASLKSQGHHLTIVSSGAIGAGIGKLNLKKVQTLRQKQALAAIGQPLIMNAYSSSLHKYKIIAAQILLTRDSFDDRDKYLNVRNTLAELIERGIIPIINENDTTAIEEINFGDNDTLAALAAIAIDADILIILTDVEGFYAGQPLKSKLLNEIKEITPEIETFAENKSSSKRGRGGMKSKIEAAKVAVSCGIDVLILHNSKHNDLEKIIKNKNCGTFFHAKHLSIKAKKSWIAFGKKTKGYIFVDKITVQMLKDKGKSLLAAGIIGIEGSFKRGDAVIISDSSKKDFARGLTNFSNTDLDLIKGKQTNEIKKIFASCEEEIIHRDNLVLL